MELFADGTTAALAIARAVHFAASAIVAGALLVSTLVADPALQAHAGTPVDIMRRQLRTTAWIGLAVALVAGPVWFVLQAQAISDLPLPDVIAPELLWTVLAETRFGLATAVRLGLAILVVVGLLGDHIPVLRRLAVVAALAFLAAIAWTGHAGAEPGLAGTVHLGADVVHLLSAGAWIGGLIPLVQVLIGSRRSPAAIGHAIARDATTRFSTLGVVAVGLLAVTGSINAVMLVGTPHLLTTTPYGRLLLVKLGFFAVMLAFAAFNREVLRPRLIAAASVSTVRQLTATSIAEIVLGLAIFAVVGVLGIQHPAIHAMH